MNRFTIHYLRFKQFIAVALTAAMILTMPGMTALADTSSDIFQPASDSSQIVSAKNTSPRVLAIKQVDPNSGGVSQSVVATTPVLPDEVASGGRDFTVQDVNAARLSQMPFLTTLGRITNGVATLAQMPWALRGVGSNRGEQYVYQGGGQSTLVDPTRTDTVLDPSRDKVALAQLQDIRNSIKGVPDKPGPGSPLAALPVPSNVTSVMGQGVNAGLQPYTSMVDATRPYYTSLNGDSGQTTRTVRTTKAVPQEVQASAGDNQKETILKLRDATSQNAAYTALSQLKVFENAAAPYWQAVNRKAQMQKMSEDLKKQIRDSQGGDAAQLKNLEDKKATIDKGLQQATTDVSDYEAVLFNKGQTPKLGPKVDELISGLTPLARQAFNELYQKTHNRQTFSGTQAIFDALKTSPETSDSSASNKNFFEGMSTRTKVIGGASVAALLGTIAVTNAWNPVGWAAGLGTLATLASYAYDGAVTNAKASAARAQAATKLMDDADKLLKGSQSKNKGDLLQAQSLLDSKAALREQAAHIMDGQANLQVKVLSGAEQALTAVDQRLAAVLQAIDEMMPPSSKRAVGQAGEIAAALVAQGYTKSRLTADAVNAAIRIYNHVDFHNLNGGTDANGKSYPAWNAEWTPAGQADVAQTFRNLGLDPLDRYLSGAQPERAALLSIERLTNQAVQSQKNFLQFQRDQALAAANGDAVAHAYISSYVGRYGFVDGKSEFSDAQIANQLNQQLTNPDFNATRLYTVGDYQSFNASAAQSNWLVNAGVSTRGLLDRVTTTNGWAQNYNDVSKNPWNAAAALGGAALGTALVVGTGGLAAPILGWAGAAATGGGLAWRGINNLENHQSFTNGMWSVLGSTALGFTIPTSLFGTAAAGEAGGLMNLVRSTQIGTSLANKVETAASWAGDIWSGVKAWQPIASTAEFLQPTSTLLGQVGTVLTYPGRLTLSMTKGVVPYTVALSAAQNALTGNVMGIFDGFTMPARMVWDNPIQGLSIKQGLNSLADAGGVLGAVGQAASFLGEANQITNEVGLFQAGGAALGKVFGEIPVVGQAVGNAMADVSAAVPMAGFYQGQIANFNYATKTGDWGYFAEKAGAMALGVAGLKGGTGIMAADDASARNFTDTTVSEGLKIGAISSIGYGLSSGLQQIGLPASWGSAIGAYGGALAPLAVGTLRGAAQADFRDRDPDGFRQQQIQRSIDEYGPKKLLLAADQSAETYKKVDRQLHQAAQDPGVLQAAADKIIDSAKPEDRALAAQILNGDSVSGMDTQSASKAREALSASLLKAQEGSLDTQKLQDLYDGKTVEVQDRSGTTYKLDGQALDRSRVADLLARDIVAQRGSDSAVSIITDAKSSDSVLRDAVARALAANPKTADKATDLMSNVGEPVSVTMAKAVLDVQGKDAGSSKGNGVIKAAQDILDAQAQQSPATLRAMAKAAEADGQTGLAAHLEAMAADHQLSAQKLAFETKVNQIRDAETKDANTHAEILGLKRDIAVAQRALTETQARLGTASEADVLKAKADEAQAKGSAVRAEAAALRANSLENKAVEKTNTNKAILLEKEATYQQKAADYFTARAEAANSRTADVRGAEKALQAAERSYQRAQGTFDARQFIAVTLPVEAEAVKALRADLRSDDAIHQQAVLDFIDQLSSGKANLNNYKGLISEIERNIPDQQTKDGDKAPEIKPASEQQMYKADGILEDLSRSLQQQGKIAELKIKLSDAADALDANSSLRNRRLFRAAERAYTAELNRVRDARISAMAKGSEESATGRTEKLVRAQLGWAELLQQWSPESGTNNGSGPTTRFLTKAKAEDLVARSEKIIESLFTDEQKKDFYERWDGAQRDAAVVALQGGDKAIEMPTGFGKTVVIAAILSDFLLAGRGNIDLILKSEDESIKYQGRHGTGDLFPGVRYIDFITRMAEVVAREKNIKIDPPVSMDEVVNRIREASSRAERDAAIADYLDIYHHPLRDRIWTSDAWGHWQTYLRSGNAPESIIQATMESANDPNGAVVGDESDASLGQQTHYRESGNTVPLGPELGKECEISFGKVTKAVGFNEKTGKFAENAPVMRAETDSAYMALRAQRKAVYWLDPQDGQMFMTKEAQTYFEKQGLWKRGIAESMLKGIETRQDYSRKDPDTKKDIFVPINQMRGDLNRKQHLDNYELAYAADRALGADSLRAQSEVQISNDTSSNSSGSYMYVHKGQTLLFSAKFDAVLPVLDAFDIPVVRLGKSKDVYKESNRSKAPLPTDLFKTPQELIDAIVNPVFEGATRLNSEGLVRRQYVTSSDSDVRTWVQRELIRKGISPDDIIMFDHSMPINQLEAAVKGKLIVITSDIRGGRGVDVNYADATNSPDLAKKYGRTFAGIDFTTDVTGLKQSTMMPLSSLHQTLGRADRKDWQDYSRRMVGYEPVVDAILQRTFRPDMRSGFLEAAEARASADSSFIGSQDVDGRDSGFTLVKKYKTDAEPTANWERIRIASWQRDMALSSRGLEGGSVDLIRDTRLELPLSRLRARLKAEGATAEYQAVNKWLTELLRHRLADPNVMESITGVQSGEQRMARALQAFQTEAVRALGGMEGELRLSRRTIELSDGRQITIKDLVKAMKQEFQDLRFNQPQRGNIRTADSLQQAVNRALFQGKKMSPTFAGPRLNSSVVLLSRSLDIAREAAKAGTLSDSEAMRIRGLASRATLGDPQARDVAEWDLLGGAASADGVRSVLIGRPVSTQPTVPSLTGFARAVTGRLHDFAYQFANTWPYNRDNVFIPRRILTTAAVAYSNSFGRAGTTPEKQVELNFRAVALTQDPVQVEQASQNINDWIDRNRDAAQAAVTPKLIEDLTQKAAQRASDKDSTAPSQEVVAQRLESLRAQTQNPIGHGVTSFGPGLIVDRSGNVITVRASVQTNGSLPVNTLAALQRASTFAKAHGNTTVRFEIQGPNTTEVQAMVKRVHKLAMDSTGAAIASPIISDSIHLTNSSSEYAQVVWQNFTARSTVPTHILGGKLSEVQTLMGQLDKPDSKSVQKLVEATLQLHRKLEELQTVVLGFANLQTGDKAFDLLTRSIVDAKNPRAMEEAVRTYLITAAKAQGKSEKEIASVNLAKALPRSFVPQAPLGSKVAVGTLALMGVGTMMLGASGWVLLAVVGVGGTVLKLFLNSMLNKVFWRQTLESKPIAKPAIIEWGQTLWSKPTLKSIRSSVFFQGNWRYVSYPLLGALGLGVIGFTMTVGWPALMTSLGNGVLAAYGASHLTYIPIFSAKLAAFGGANAVQGVLYAGRVGFALFSLVTLSLGIVSYMITHWRYRHLRYAAYSDTALPKPAEKEKPDTAKAEEKALSTMAQPVAAKTQAAAKALPPSPELTMEIPQPNVLAAAQSPAVKDSGKTNPPDAVAAVTVKEPQPPVLSDAAQPVESVNAQEPVRAVAEQTLPKSEVAAEVPVIVAQKAEEQPSASTEEPAWSSFRADRIQQARRQVSRSHVPHQRIAKKPVREGAVSPAIIDQISGEEGPDSLVGQEPVGLVSRGSSWRQSVRDARIPIAAGILSALAAGTGSAMETGSSLAGAASPTLMQWLGSIFSNVVMPSLAWAAVVGGAAVVMSLIVRKSVDYIRNSADLRRQRITGERGTELTERSA